MAIIRAELPDGRLPTLPYTWTRDEWKSLNGGAFMIDFDLSGTGSSCLGMLSHGLWPRIGRIQTVYPQKEVFKEKAYPNLGFKELLSHGQLCDNSHSMRLMQVLEMIPTSMESSGRGIPCSRLSVKFFKPCSSNHAKIFVF